MNSFNITFEVARNLVAKGIISFPAFGISSILMIKRPLAITISELERVVNSFYKTLKYIEFVDLIPKTDPKKIK